MTNERHEKALEAAVTAYKKAYSEEFTDIIASLVNSSKGQRSDVIVRTTMRAAIIKAIAAYLEAMDAVIVPREPTEEMLEAGEKYVPFGRLAEHKYRAMLSKAPQHFTNGE